MFLQDLSLLINMKKIILFIVLARLRRVILSKKFNGLGREEYLHRFHLPLSGVSSRVSHQALP